MSTKHPAGAIEFEAKFLKIDHAWARRKLEELGGIRTEPRRMMRRVNMDFPDFRLKERRAWVRVRDEGDGITTLTFKSNQGDHLVDGIREVETTVGNYDKTLEFLRAIGLIEKSYQETYRESWKIDDVMVELDEWPWLDPFLEIEASYEAGVRETVAQFGLDWSKAIFGPIHNAYMTEYDVTRDDVNHLPEYKFDTPPPWPRK